MLARRPPPSQTVNLVSVTFASHRFFFVPVMHQRQTIGNEWRFIALLEILTNNRSTLQRKLATACWVKKLHCYYNVHAIHFRGEHVCLLLALSLSVTPFLS